MKVICVLCKQLTDFDQEVIATVNEFTCTKCGKQNYIMVFDTTAKDIFDKTIEWLTDPRDEEEFGDLEDQELQDTESDSQDSTKVTAENKGFKLL